MNEFIKVKQSISKNWLKKAENAMDQLAEKLEKERDLSRIKVVVDMDAFGAAVEMREDPWLRNVQFAVHNNGAISAANYAARKFGIKAGMRMPEAKKKCETLHAVPYNKQKCNEAAQEIRQVLAHYDPHFKVTLLTVDEYLLDITDFVKARDKPNVLPRIRYAGECQCRLPRYPEHTDDNTTSSVEHTEESCETCGKTRVIMKDEVSFGTTAEEVVQEIRFQIEQKTGMTASAGIAADAGLAKICSEKNKPNGQFLLENDRQRIIDFMRDVPISEGQGIGASHEKKLTTMGISKCGDLYARRGYIRILLSPQDAEMCLRNSLGILKDTYVEKSREKMKRSRQSLYPEASQVNAKRQR